MIGMDLEPPTGAFRRDCEGKPVCRNINTLYHIDPPATEAEVRAAALQYVRKVSGFSRPSIVNRAAFLSAVDAIAAATHTLLITLDTEAPPRKRPAPARPAGRVGH